MKSDTEESSEGSGSVRAAISIFGESISGWRPSEMKNRSLQAPVQEDSSSGLQELAKSSRQRLRERKASAEREGARAESELSRARARARELERQVEQTNAKARSQRSELQAAWRKRGAEAPDAQEGSNGHYAEVMQELDRVKKQLRKLKLHVRSVMEAKAKAEREVEASASKMRSSLRVADDMRQQIDEANEEHVLVELARIEAERERRDIEAQRDAEARRFAQDMEAARKKTKGLQREINQANELEAKLAETNSDVEVLQNEMALVRAMERNHAKNEADTASKKKNREESESKALLQATETELDAAKKELASIKEESFQFMASMDRTRTEITLVTDEIARLKEQEEKADAQVQHLNAKLLKAKSRKDFAAAANERPKAIVANLTAALQQLQTEIEAARKEKELAELETRCVRADTEAINRDIADAEDRVRLSVKELEAVKAEEAAAMRKLKSAVESTMQARSSSSSASPSSATVTISRFEHEYLTGRAGLVRAVADKKVAAAHAWVRALKAGEKEIAMRVAAVEREIRELRAQEAELAREAPEAALRREPSEMQQDEAETEGMQCAYPPRRSVRESRTSATSRRTPKGRRVSVSSAGRSQRSPSFPVKRKRRVIPNFLKLIRERRVAKSRN